MTTREAVFPFGRQGLYERNRYSPAIKSNGFLFVSGQVGSREDGSPEEDLNAQIRLAFDNLNAVLAAAGCTFDDVVDVTLFVVDPESNLDAIWSILPEYWGEAPYPTLTGIGVTWLYGFQFEIKVRYVYNSSEKGRWIHHAGGSSRRAENARAVDGQRSRHDH
ncbi:hypothetical protein L1887_46250 [Cichorium endivia]|nr:hypothetical protein L1887_46250 [Cichorium endivia]